MKTSPVVVLAAFPLLLLAGCVSVPTGPSVMALPGTGKSFEQFRFDEAECRQYALQQAGGAEQSAADAGVRSAAVGTVVGAVAGAAIGGRDGAGIGAGSGLLLGSMAGTGAAQSSAYGTQRNYDNAFIQCMYAKRHKVPVSGAYTSGQAPPAVASPPAPAGYYPPPPGRR
ncbi:MAG: glycine zipper family protein [Rhodocyclaceae bacterium]